MSQPGTSSHQNGPSSSPSVSSLPKPPNIVILSASGDSLQLPLSTGPGSQSHSDEPQNFDDCSSLMTGSIRNPQNSSVSVSANTVQVGDSREWLLVQYESSDRIPGRSSNEAPGVSNQLSGGVSERDPSKNKNQSSLDESHEHRFVDFCQGGIGKTSSDSEQNRLQSRSPAQHPQGEGSKPSMNQSLDSLQTGYVQPTLEDLPKEVLLNIVQRLPTVTLIACAAAHEVFANLINDVQFLNWHTRFMLGFPANQRDITYDIVPAPIASLQDLWFQAYLYRAAPNMVGLVRPGVIFYDLLCFKHLLDTWILQGLGYKHWMFISDVLKSPRPPPLPFLKCKRLAMVSSQMLHMLTKVALCSPEILLFTVNDFEELNISSSPPSDLDDAWDRSVPADWKSECRPQHTCEVVSRQRGLALASFFFTFDSNVFIGWCGVIDYSSFRWKDTWGLCKFSSTTAVNDMKCYCTNLFQRFIEYTGREYISIHCPNAFLFRSLGKLIIQREMLLPEIQDTLEKTALCVTRKLKKTLSVEVFKELKVFLDGIQLLDIEEASTNVRRKATHHESSKTLEVAVQRYLHRYLNRTIGRKVLQLYNDPICHHVLCITCRNTHIISVTPFCVCMERVGPQRIPLKIWPPHLLHQAAQTLPALAKLVRLDIELWKRGLLGDPLSEKVELFVRQVSALVHLDFNLHPNTTGVIARRILE